MFCCLQENISLEEKGQLLVVKESCVIFTKLMESEITDQSALRFQVIKTRAPYIYVLKFCEVHTSEHDIVSCVSIFSFTLDTVAYLSPPL